MKARSAYYWWQSLSKENRKRAVELVAVKGGWKPYYALEVIKGNYARDIARKEDIILQTAEIIDNEKDPFNCRPSEHRGLSALAWYYCLSMENRRRAINAILVAFEVKTSMSAMNILSAKSCPAKREERLMAIAKRIDGKIPFSDRPFKVK